MLSDGASWSATWNYARTLGTGAASATLVTAPKLSYDPAANQSILQFQGIYETQSDVYQGSAPTFTSLPISEATLQTSGLLQEIQACYNGSSAPCPGTAVGSIASQSVTAIFPGSGGLQSKVVTSYNSYGQLSEEDDYGYGAGAPGSLLRKKLITIQTVGTYQAIQTAQIQDGSGNVKAQTTMTFDQGRVTATTGTPQHANPTVGRGNPTTISYLVQGSAALTKTLQFFDTGNVQSITDVNNATTTYTYSSEAASCGNAFPTGVTEAISSLSQSMVWNCNGGVATSTTDENGKVVSTSYTDADFWRPYSTTDQLSNISTFSYGGETSVESSMPFNGTVSTSDTLVTLDGLGRSHISQTKQGPSSTTYDSVETDYDLVGRPSRVTQPYSGNAGQTCTGTCPSTTTAYDALSRPTLVTDGGGGTVGYSYAQNDVYQTLGPKPANDANAKRRQLEYDALGRLTSVCEVTAGTTAWPGGTCAQTSAQTGYWTKYTYDANGNLTGVTQNAQGSSQQARTYVYDDLSRMTSETNPESGTTTYVYDSSSTCSGGSNFPGDLTEKHDAAGNFTCFWYDGLHRLLTEWVNSGPGQWGISGCKRFFYDNTNGTLGSKPSGVSVSNVLGRLTEAETDACAWPVTQSSLLTDEWFSYTVRGETSDLWASTPHSGGYNHTQASYWANGATNTVQMIGGDGYGNAYNLDGEGRVYSTTNGNLTGTSYNNASQPTQVNYGSGDSDSFTYTNTGQMSKYTYNVNGQSVVGTLTWNPLGTLGSLVITDPYNSSNAQTCNYAHDDLIRIASASCTSTPAWSQTFTYDAFGNIDKAGNSSFGATYSPTTNRMTTIGTNTPTYDADGNVTNDFLHSYSWDAYGRPLTIDTVGVTYDAFGRMVEQNRSGTNTEIEYSPTGFKMQLITNGAYTAFVPLPGGAEAVWPGGQPYYRHPDWLGSSRLTSTTSRTVQGDEAYAPFGETYAASGTPDNSFTGMDQGTVANEYDFPAREYGIQGRWPSPDPAGLAAVDPSNPQSWDRYAYVLNNPLAMTDATGMEGIPVFCADPVSCIIESIISAIFDIFQFLFSPPPPPQAAPPPPGGYGAGIEPYGTFDEAVPAGVQAFPSAFPGSGTNGGLPGLANAGFGDGLPGVIGTAGTICLFVPVCGEVEIGTVGTVIIVGGVIAAGGAIIHEGVKDGIITIPNIHLAKGGPQNVVDMGIMNEVNQMIRDGLANGICDALKKLYDASIGERRNKIKATQKAKGCRGH